MARMNIRIYSFDIQTFLLVIDIWAISHGNGDHWSPGPLPPWASLISTSDWVELLSVSYLTVWPPTPLFLHLLLVISIQWFLSLCLPFGIMWNAHPIGPRWQCFGFSCVAPWIPDDRYFHFLVSTKSVGIMIHRIGKVICKNFFMHFTLWRNCGFDYVNELRKWI